MKQIDIQKMAGKPQSKTNSFEEEKNSLSAERKAGRRILPGILLSLGLFTLLSGTEVLAGSWIRDPGKNAWWYDTGNGNYYRSSWQWIGDDRDGYAECYHFDNQGWMAESTVTADGYTVNQNGAWTVNGVVQTRRVAKNTAASQSAYPKDAYENEVLNRINQYRAGRGLRPCRENEVLDNFAEKRARECAVLFSHTRPQGGSILSESQVCGEILACNLRTPESVVSAWRKSPNHNRVMLRHDFVSFGTGHYIDSSGNEYSVVLFSFYN